jgi:hypothetical protein
MQKCLIVCGYGFGDKGVNNILIDWMHSDANAKMVVLQHPEPSTTVGQRLAGMSRSGVKRESSRKSRARQAWAT